MKSATFSGSYIFVCECYSKVSGVTEGFCLRSLLRYLSWSVLVLFCFPTYYMVLCVLRK